MLSPSFSSSPHMLSNLSCVYHIYFTVHLLGLSVWHRNYISLSLEDRLFIISSPLEGIMGIWVALPLLSISLTQICNLSFPISKTFLTFSFSPQYKHHQIYTHPPTHTHIHTHTYTSTHTYTHTHTHLQVSDVSCRVEGAPLMLSEGGRHSDHTVLYHLYMHHVVVVERCYIQSVKLYYTIWCIITQWNIIDYNVIQIKILRIWNGI